MLPSMGCVWGLGSAGGVDGEWAGDGIFWAPRGLYLPVCDGAAKANDKIELARSWMARGRAVEVA